MDMDMEINEDDGLEFPYHFPNLDDEEEDRHGYYNGFYINRNVDLGEEIPMNTDLLDPSTAIKDHEFDEVMDILDAEEEKHPDVPVIGRASINFLPNNPFLREILRCYGPAAQIWSVVDYAPHERKRLLTKNLLLDMLQTIISHPVAFMNVLIQIGYEPYEPVHSRFIFWTYFPLQNKIFYFKYLVEALGPLGLYQGLVHHVVYRFVKRFVTNTVMYHYYYKRADDGRWVKRKRDTYVGFWKLSLETVGWELVSGTIGVILSQPFYVAMIRSMASIVGGERTEPVSTTAKELFLMPFTTVREVFNTDGITGLFKGLWPRLRLNWYSIAVCGMFTWFFTFRIHQHDWAMKFIWRNLARWIPVSMTLVTKLQVITNSWIVNDAGLTIGSPPYTPVHSNMSEMITYLQSRNQLQRGYRNFFRNYYGPTRIDEGRGGIRVPDVPFGPNLLDHPRSNP